MRQQLSHQRSVSRLARQAIMTYTQPNDLIIDPICGTGDILIEALKADRMAIGLEYEQYWADMAKTRIEQATASRLEGSAAVVQGTVERFVHLAEMDCAGRAPLLLTAPQAGTSTRFDGAGTASCLDEFVDGVISAIINCQRLLRPAAAIAVICQPARRTDIAGIIHEGFVDAGFEPADRQLTQSTSVRLMLFNSRF